MHSTSRAVSLCRSSSFATTMATKTGSYVKRASCTAAVLFRSSQRRCAVVSTASPCHVSPPCHPLLLMATYSDAATIAPAVNSSQRLRGHATWVGTLRLFQSLSLTSSLSLASSSAARRCTPVGVVMTRGGPSTTAVWCMARRYASTGRRPTFAEIAEALEVLGTGIDEDPKVLKAKYRELVKKNHPDAGGEQAAMARVTVAYERLSALTSREKEDFTLQKKRLCSRGGTPSAASRRYRPGPPGGFGYAAPNEPFQAHAANMYGQYYQQDADSAYHQAHAKGQQGFWNHFYNRSGSGGFAENPFTSSSPFSMYAQAQRARFTPSSSLLIQGLVVYLILSTMFLFAYRSYRDWRHDDGWRMSESLARHEQMEEIHRIRQEMNERARAMQPRDDFVAAALYGSRQYVRESPEARALEYARQRRIQMMQEQQEALENLPELRGWPKIGEDKGRIIKRAQDPSGVVFFEPRKEDSRRRQIENQRRSSGFVRRSPSESPSPQLSEAAHGGLLPDTSAPTAVTSSCPANSSAPLPPEANVSSIVMKPVGSEEEAQAVMRGIFGGLRKSTS
ncbi:hypothetical protein JIQ42_06615 [Leishmania sp. Namibia]|uniref:hypothetical protein n=1 Tax=Leishmania sp. Namibia TaxID=2802991 RepID=UPI001B462FE6|nr:hypothetical protein JIQ42_06615 [Leishmania sp. Namibia]